MPLLASAPQISAYGWGSSLNTAQPGYAPPPLKDLVLMYIAFDVLVLDGRDLCSLTLQVCVGGGRGLRQGARSPRLHAAGM